MLAESSALWAKELDDQPECVGPDTAQILRAGLEVSTVDYRAAVRVCTAIRAEMDAAFAEHRLSGLLLPTVPVTAAEADAEFVEVNGRTEHIESAYARLTVLASASGHPALSVPAGRDHQGLPIGAQLIGPRRTETTLCLLGSVIERHANEGH
jgi:aspartyl-tRNA(Asn)/glutamyl-tRNA(Gln) amidotransferase subunit A